MLDPKNQPEKERQHQCTTYVVQVSNSTAGNANNRNQYVTVSLLFSKNHCVKSKILCYFDAHHMYVSATKQHFTHAN